MKITIVDSDPTVALGTVKPLTVVVVHTGQVFMVVDGLRLVNMKDGHLYTDFAHDERVTILESSLTISRWIGTTAVLA
jgi:hypothetical protein